MQDEQGQTSEEYMQAVTIGERKPHRGPVELVDYDPEWPALFRREEERIRDALEERALQVEHAGSSSVPGLIAKPIIDIVLAVADSTDERSEEHTSELQSRENLVCRLLLEKKKI